MAMQDKLHFYILLDDLSDLPKGCQSVEEDFMYDYYCHYSKKVYSDYEMLFIDWIYQMILDSHLISDCRNETITKTIVNRISAIDEAGYDIIDKEVVKEKKYNRYHEYMLSDYYEKCRSYAKDIEFCLLREEIDCQYLIQQFQESETSAEFERNITKYLDTYYQFCRYLDYQPDKVQIITSRKNMSDWLTYHCIRFVTF